MADRKASYIGGKSGSITLPEPVFGQRFNGPLVHETVRAEMNARRRGTASTLTRGEVAMTGAKAWRQKGTGRARVGPLAVGHRRGGGTIFGPKPRAYTVKVNRKARAAALRAALSLHAERGSLAVVDAPAFGKPNTKQAATALTAWRPTGSVVVVLGVDGERDCELSFRNIARVRAVLSSESVGVADLLGAECLVISDAALTALVERLTREPRGAEAGAVEKQAA